MDGFTGFKTATTQELPEAVAVMDPFHACDDAYRKSPVSLIEFPHPVALMRLADCVGFEGVEQVGYRDGFSAVGAGAAEADAGAGLVAVVAPLLAVVAGVAG